MHHSTKMPIMDQPFEAVGVRVHESFRLFFFLSLSNRLYYIWLSMGVVMATCATLKMNDLYVFVFKSSNKKIKLKGNIITLCVQGHLGYENS